jgi:tRNA dimethylallyltransferase
MALAASRLCTIISADSRQVYRGFDIGTAKPTRAEQQSVPHRGIDVAEPHERYSAARWAAAVDEWIDESLANHRLPIVVGGTGLYVRAAFEGLFDEPELDPSRRRALDEFLGVMPRDELQRWVTQLDPGRVHLGRTQLLRAIELALLTGQRVSALHRQRARQPRWRARYLLVDPGPALAGRLVSRIDAMFAGGWIEEVRSLARTVPADAPAWNATGYRHVRAMVVNETMTYAATHERIVIDTRQYAKRQRTWFRHQLPADRVSHVDPLSANALEVAERWLADVATLVPARGE